MSATVAEQPKSAIERERKELYPRLRAMQEIGSTPGIRPLEGRLRAISLLADLPPVQATEVAADPPHPAGEGSAKEWPDASTAPDGKPLREAGATQIVKILAEAQRDRRQAEAAAMAEEFANLVNRIVAWMKNSPPFATAPSPSGTPERRPSFGPTMEPCR